jgi:hypothetical protein
VFSDTGFTTLLGSGFQQWTFLSRTVPGLSYELLQLTAECLKTHSLSLSLLTKSKSKSKLCYDRQSVGQFLLMSSRIWGPRQDFCYCRTVTGLFMWSTPSDERTDPSFLSRSLTKAFSVDFTILAFSRHTTVPCIISFIDKLARLNIVHFMILHVIFHCTIYVTAFILCEFCDMHINFDKCPLAVFYTWSQCGISNSHKTVISLVLETKYFYS